MPMCLPATVTACIYPGLAAPGAALRCTLGLSQEPLDTGMHAVLILKWKNLDAAIFADSQSQGVAEPVTRLCVQSPNKSSDL